jgi:hypothetical protein
MLCLCLFHAHENSQRKLGCTSLAVRSCDSCVVSFCKNCLSNIDPHLICNVIPFPYTLNCLNLLLSERTRIMLSLLTSTILSLTSLLKSVRVITFWLSCAQFNVLFLCWTPPCCAFERSVLRPWRLDISLRGVLKFGGGICDTNRNTLLTLSHTTLWLASYNNVGLQRCYNELHRVAEKSPYTDKFFPIQQCRSSWWNLIKPLPERSHHLGQGLSRVLSLVHPHTCHQALPR